MWRSQWLNWPPPTQLIWKNDEKILKFREMTNSFKLLTLPLSRTNQIFLNFFSSKLYHRSYYAYIAYIIITRCACQISAPCRSNMINAWDLAAHGGQVYSATVQPLAALRLPKLFIYAGIHSENRILKDNYVRRPIQINKLIHLLDF